MIQIAYVIFWWLALVGLLILTYLAWMLSSLHVLPFGWGSILISFLLLAALSLYLGRKNLRITNWPRKPIIISESIFTVSFILFVLIMVGRPDIYFDGADYFMDFTFMSSIIRADYPVSDTHRDHQSATRNSL